MASCVHRWPVADMHSVYAPMARTGLPPAAGVSAGISLQLYSSNDSSGVLNQVADDEDGIVERDEDERFCRYDEVIGRGRCKLVYKGFDEREGLDVAWGVISADEQHLDAGSMHRLLAESQWNTQLKHKNIIRCFKCWQSGKHINIVTELFTSGTLRDFIQQHEKMGCDALRKFTKQIVEGISYLHSQEPPAIHGHLGCDKIFVNGNEGTVKIGNLGLATMATAPAAVPTDPTPADDIWALGCCIVEMYTRKPANPALYGDHLALADLVPDDSARALVQQCLLPPSSRPSAATLLEQFFSSARPKLSPARNPTSSMESLPSCNSFERVFAFDPAVLESSINSSVRSYDTQPPHLHVRTVSHSSLPAEEPPIPHVKTCHLRGEDYVFSVRQSSRENSYHVAYVQLTMATVELVNGSPVCTRTIEFEHQLDDETPEEVGSELQDAYSLTNTDKDMVVAIIREACASCGSVAWAHPHMCVLS